MAGLAAILAIVGCRIAPDGTTEPAPAPTTAQPKGAAGPAPLDGMAEEGRFVVYLQDTPIATIDHVWKTDGSYHAKADMRYAGQSMPQSLAIEVDDAGGWSRIEAGSRNHPATLVRDGLRVEVTGAKGAESLEIAPGTVFLPSSENFNPALLRHVLRRYDDGAGGTQMVPAVMPGSLRSELRLTREPDASRRLGGREVTLARWRIEIGGVPFSVWSEADERVVMVQAPAVVLVREGYEPLMPVPEDPDPLVSRAEHTVVLDDEVATPMRDGTVLRADVYRPAGEGPWPTIVVRTPYMKEVMEIQARYFARRGYAYVVQDVRGRFASPGEWTPMVNEKPDGYDTIEWAAAQPWSTGKVGMVGLSYLGWVQWLAAVERPPHLVTIIPNCAPPDPFYNIPYEHGVMHTFGSLWWLGLAATEANADMTGKRLRELNAKPYDQLLRTLPVLALDETVLGGESRLWREWAGHTTHDAYWQRASYLEELSKVDLPVLNQSGWFDDDGIGAKLTMQRMTALGREHQHIIMGPWGHVDTATRDFGGLDFGPEAVSIDLQREFLRWFDRWLKGVDNGIDRQPKVRLFAMGSNRWVSGNAYPLEDTTFEKWYLRSDGHANGSGGDGALVREPGGAATDVYVYDPGDATPDLEFRSPEEWPDMGGIADHVAARARRQARHERLLTERKDVLVYESEPFVEDATFVGPVSAVLHAATTAKDTDWFVSLVELDAEGKPQPLVQGKVRARFRKSAKRPTLVRPGKIERYELDLWQTGITVRKGHRLRVEVASASFPTWGRNLNTGGDSNAESEHVAATQTIHHSKRYPSYVLLPRVANPE